MAPVKGQLIQRLTSANFLGFNWMKVTHHGPFQSQYPFTAAAGSTTRMWSQPRFQGNRVNRMSFNTGRMLALYLPSLALAGVILGMCEWYNLRIVAEAVLGIPIPDDVKQARLDELDNRSRNKPGVLLKHKYGNQVSIKGSEKLILGDS